MHENLTIETSFCINKADGNIHVTVCRLKQMNGKSIWVYFIARGYFERQWQIINNASCPSHYILFTHFVE